ncbi:MAG: S53 family peptidase [Patescibacteria group bacterium]|nr:S53 family peptidase [Patescibacteria group bacterium]MDE2116431.1 S53 family peptidase [Patescibacteria group bacterium]
MRHTKNILYGVLLCMICGGLVSPAALLAATKIRPAVTVDDFVAHVPIHVLGSATGNPQGLAPGQIKEAYDLPSTGGSGTIALIAAFDDKEAESDLAAFDSRFGLAACTTANGCFEKHMMGKTLKQSSGWALETALDTQWSHAIAPKAKILLVEATSDSGTALLKAVDYARSRSDVVAISMSWGGPEFKNEASDDGHFESSHGAVFFAASGDDGHAASWPAASPNVVAVGGTALSFDKNGAYASEKAWSGSGGGVSAYETEPAFQKDYSISKANGKRAIPDVSFDADPSSGYSVYHASAGTSAAATGRGWYVVGGTSAGSPQWAAIRALDRTTGTSSASFLALLYADKAAADNSRFFRDITSGKNGSCVFYCTARKRYDYVTGLGSPVTYRF